MYPSIGKPVLDRLAALILLVMLAWLFVLVALVFLASSNLPVFYRADRMGLHGAKFRMIKFRTLHNDHSMSLSLRRWWWGDFLRFTSLDELPQLWNVLRGDMSLIGPRPLPYDYGRLMNETQQRRHNVKPGITGWAQVNGRHSISWSEKFALDLHYVDNLSLSLDASILWRTIRLPLSMKADQSLDEKPFAGNHD